jgi:hypothetical protein
MNKWLKKFNVQYRERLLHLSWGQWTTLGVPGHTQTISGSLIDPDALLVFSCFIARYDQRLFDEILEWLVINGSLLNVQRLKRMILNSPDTLRSILGAVALWMRQRQGETKWASLSQSSPAPRREEPLFFLKEGRPMPVTRKIDPTFLPYGFLRNEIKLRDHGKSFPPLASANLILKLRAFLGVNSRADLAAYLLTHEEANAYEMARSCWFSQRAVHDTLTQMRLSQMIQSAERRREIVYFIQGDRWDNFLKVIRPLPDWRNWPMIFRLLYRIHEKLTDEKIMQASGEPLNSEMILFARNLEPAIHEAGLTKIWVTHHPESAGHWAVGLEKMISAILDELTQ